DIIPVSWDQEVGHYLANHITLDYRPQCHLSDVLVIDCYCKVEAASGYQRRVQRGEARALQDQLS
ncbi:hypothetical protein NHX12_020612, partial [Muraenolepis orangiensis]